MNNPNVTTALGNALKGRARVRVLGLTLDDVVRYFFAGNATVALVVLTLILVFLTKEGFGFFGQNQRNLSIYRKAGLEYVDLMRVPVEEYTALTRAVGNVRIERLKKLLADGKSLEEANESLAGFDQFTR